MNNFTIRRRLIEDGASAQEADERIEELAEQANEEARDRAAEEFFRNGHEPI